jgi:hypothetical protein
LADILFVSLGRYFLKPSDYQKISLDKISFIAGTELLVD